MVSTNDRRAQHAPARRIVLKTGGRRSDGCLAGRTGGCSPVLFLGRPADEVRSRGMGSRRVAPSPAIMPVAFSASRPEGREEGDIIDAVRVGMSAEVRSRSTTAFPSRSCFCTIWTAGAMRMVAPAQCWPGR